MGTLDVTGDLDAANLRQFIKHLLDDLRALEAMIAGGTIESGVRRIGAEQELFLVDRAWRPAPFAMEILAAIDDPHFTTELARFNLEINLDPLPFGGDCLRRLEGDLAGLLAKVRAVAQTHGVAAVLTGILPTLRKSDLVLGNMTPKTRYHALNDAMSRLRGGDYEFRLKGLDELNVKHDSVMLEACCTAILVQNVPNTMPAKMPIREERSCSGFKHDLAATSQTLAVKCSERHDLDRVSVPIK